MRLGGYFPQLPWGSDGYYTTYAYDPACVTRGGHKAAPDHLGRFLFGMNESVSDVIDLAEVLGHSSSNNSVTSFLLEGAAPAAGSNYSSRAGVLNGFLYNCRSLFRDWDFGNEVPDTMSEHSVSHLNITGRLTGNITDPMYYRWPFDQPYTRVNGVRRYAGIKKGTDGKSTVIVGSPANGYLRYPVKYWLDTYGDTYYGEPFAGGRPDVSFSCYTDIQHEWFEPRVGYVMYVHHYQYVNPSDDYITQTSTAIRHHVIVVPSGVPTPDDTLVYLNDYVQLVLVTEVKRLCYRKITPYSEPLDIKYQWPSNWPAWTAPSLLGAWPGAYKFELGDSHPWLEHAPLDNSNNVLTFLGFDSVTGYQAVSQPPSQCLSDFGHEVYQARDDCYALCAVSAKDAIDNMFSTLESQHFETLSELDDLFSIVSTTQFLQSVLKVRKDPRRSMLKIMDLLTDATLVYSFGIAPTISDAKDVAAKASSLRANFSELGKVRVGNGTKTYDLAYDSQRFPVFEKFPGAKVTARSKVVLRMEPDSYLSALLPVRAIGLLPSLSGIWDVIPFSFLIDWFTRTGAALDLADTTAMFMVLDCMLVVNSITITYPFSSEDSEEYHFTIEDKAGPDSRGSGYRFYDRFVTKNPVLPVPTRLPILGDVGIPNYSVATSLLWKLIRA